LEKKLSSRAAEKLFIIIASKREKLRFTAIFLAADKSNPRCNEADDLPDVTQTMYYYGDKY